MNEKIKVLVVEDEALTAIMINKSLESNGFEVCESVATGENAVKKVNTEKPDVILMDISLAGEIDGIEAAKQILMIKSIPIIFMTGYSIDEYMIKLEELNPVIYISKPVEIMKVITLINSILNLR